MTSSLQQTTETLIRLGGESEGEKGEECSSLEPVWADSSWDQAKQSCITPGHATSKDTLSTLCDTNKWWMDRIQFFEGLKHYSSDQVNHRLSLGPQFYSMCISLLSGVFPTTSLPLLMSLIWPLLPFCTVDLMDSCTTSSISKLLGIQVFISQPLVTWQHEYTVVSLYTPQQQFKTIL